MKGCWSCMLSCTALLSGNVLHAHWGLQTTLFHLETVTKSPNLVFVAGVDVDPTERTSIALDFTYGLGDPADFAIADNSYSGNGVLYELEYRVLGLTYRSEYFWRDNDRVSGYFGPFVGFRRSTYEIKPVLYNVNIANYISGSTVNVSTMTFPVGLRVGFRNGLSCYCQDNYISTGYNFGVGNTDLPGYLKDKHQLSMIFFQLGFSFGIGFDK